VRRNLERRIRSLEQQTQPTPAEVAKGRLLELFTLAWERRVGLLPTPTECEERILNSARWPEGVPRRPRLDEQTKQRVVAVLWEAASRPVSPRGIQIAWDRVQRFRAECELSEAFGGEASA